MLISWREQNVGPKQLIVISRYNVVCVCVCSSFKRHLTGVEYIHGAKFPARRHYGGPEKLASKL